MIAHRDPAMRPAWTGLGGGNGGGAVLPFPVGTGPLATQGIFPRLTAAQRAAAAPEVLLSLSAGVRGDMEAYLAESVPALLERHRSSVEDLRRIEAYLDNRNPDAPPRLGIANFNTPLMLWHCNAAANRLERSIFEHQLPVTLQPTGRKHNDLALVGALNRLATFVEHGLTSTRMLNGRACIGNVIRDMTDVGSGAWAVVLEPDTAANRPDRVGAGYEESTTLRRRDGAPRMEPPTAVTRALRAGGVTWEFIPFANLIYWDGYESDFNRMPYAGYQTRKTWQQLTTWAAQGFYYRDAVASVQEHYTDRSRVAGVSAPGSSDSIERAAHLREHDVAVLFTSWDVNGDGLAEEVAIELHLDALRVLRVYWNQFDGYRPLVAAQYARPARRMQYRGMGVGQMTIQSQAEANDLHNYTLEAGKRGGAWMIVTRRDSGIDEELSDDSEPFIPGDQYSTEDIEKDVRVDQLGDPQAGQFLTLLEERLQQQAARLTGFNDPNLGNVSSAKRVPGGLGQQIMAQASSGSDAAITSLSLAIQEALYLTFAAWKKRIPMAALRAILEPADAELLLSLVFAPGTGVDLREDVAITVVGKDTTQQKAQQQRDLMLLIQVLMNYFDRVAALIQTSTQAAMTLQQVNPGAGQAVLGILMMLLTKIQASVAALVRTAEELGDPQDVLLELGELERELQALFAPAQPPTAPGMPPQQQPALQQPLAADLGAGVA
jgi:hypothetical protein